VSTAYYAVFHLLIEDAAQRWNGSPESVTGMERSFTHAGMRNISTQFDNARWRDWHGILQSVPPELQRVAGAFVDLQQERHKADYDNHEPWTVIDVEEVLTRAEDAFRDWAAIRTHPAAGNYLTAMLLGKPRP
jgi:hypothetical protein